MVANIASEQNYNISNEIIFVAIVQSFIQLKFGSR